MSGRKKTSRNLGEGGKTQMLKVWQIITKFVQLISLKGSVSETGTLKEGMEEGN